MSYATQYAPPAARPAAERVPPAPAARPPYGAALLAGLAVFALYAFTLGPTTWFWDTSEYIATAHILGIPHPPGNPLFVVLARAWELLLAPFGLSVAVRINLFSAFMSATTAALWFLVAHRVLAFFSPSETLRRVGAAAAVLVSATAYTVWFQATVNEKVYTISLVTIALLTWIAFRWRDHTEAHRAAPAAARPERGWHEDNLLVLAAFILALSVGNHLMAFLAAPALALYVFLVRPQTLLNWRLYAWSAVFAVLGLSVHLFLPLRAALNPIINEADPTCQSFSGALTSVLTLGKAGCAELSAALAREQYAKPPVTLRQAPFADQLTNYFQYFDWQWARSLMGNVGYLAPARLPFTLLFLGLGLFGAWKHWKRDRVSFAYIATLFATLSVGLIFYLNFKYGYGQVLARGMQMDLAEVRERDYFFLVSFSVWGMWAGIGIAALWFRLMDSVPGKHAALLASPVLALALIPLVLNFPYADRSDDYAARDWAYNLLMSVEPYGVLFTNGDNDTFPLWYMQEVEGIRQDVTVIVASYFNTPWYAKQIRELTQPCPTPGAAAAAPTRIVCQRPFEPAEAPIYASFRAPTRSILPLPDAQIDAITNLGYVILSQDQLFQARGIQTTFAAQTPLMAADQFILAVIKDAWGDRPVYFAATTNKHRELGLGDYVVRQGVAFKLVTPEEVQAGGYVPMPQNTPYSPIFGAYLDVPRTQQLLWDTFQYHNLLTDPHWEDDATRGIPTYYGYAHLALGQAQAMLGNEPAAERNVQRYEAWMDLAER